VRQHLGRPFRFVELANDINEHMPDHVYDRIAALLNAHRKPVNGSRVLLLGLAYKRATSDWRESPTVPLAQLLAAGGASVSIADPNIPEVNVARLAFPLVAFSAEQLAAADLVVVLVDHPEFDPAFIAQHAPVVFDAKGLMRGTQFEGETL
jgi:UDP-N-acetyl-D-mannosaminuronate dehydrogenase